MVTHVFFGEKKWCTPKCYFGTSQQGRVKIKLQISIWIWIFQFAENTTFYNVGFMFILNECDSGKKSLVPFCSYKSVFFKENKGGNLSVLSYLLLV